jgi:putative inorganic carbon (hco3(-)) transporter
MLSDLLWTTIILTFVVLGLRNPYIALSGVVFVDILKPQDLSFSFLAGQPVSFTMTAFMLVSMFFNFNQIRLPKKLFPLFLIVFFMIWVTITTYQAVFPHWAWHKYDYVIKTILFSLFVPFVIDNRVKFDTFVAILVSAISFYTVALGLKTVVGGGGYGQVLIQTSSTNSGMAESSTMSMVAVLNIGMALYLANYSVFSDKIRYINLTSRFLIFASVMSIIGTFARTGLVGLFTWIGLQVSRSKKKWKFVIGMVLVVLIVLPFAPPEWLGRMSTITDPTKESSAYGRLVVWQWSIDYSAENALFGGGFNSFIANAGQLAQYAEAGRTIGFAQTGKATHNIFFQVLTEHGYVGFTIFMLMIFQVLIITRRLIKDSATETWIKRASLTIKDSLIVYCICGMFIDIAYYPWLYYFVGLAICLFSINSTLKQAAKEVALTNLTEPILHR